MTYKIKEKSKSSLMKRCLLFIFALIPCSVNSQIITLFAGNSSSGPVESGVPAISAAIPNPAGGMFDKYGNYFFADEENSNRIRKIDTAGIITTVAGNGTGGFAGDNGIATSAELYRPTSVKLDTAGNIYIADLSNERVRRVDAGTGIITTIAGTGTAGFTGDSNLATAAEIYGPEDICLDKFGNLYIADAFNYRIRKVNPAGIITTIAGNGTAGYSGEGTIADTSMIGFTTGICSDTAGDIFIANNSGCRILKINTSGIMTTVAGSGVPAYSGDNIPATIATICPELITVDKFNNLFITDHYNYRTYKVDTFGIIHTVAGNGIAGDGGDGGPAISASLYWPDGIAIDPCGNLYISNDGSVTDSGKNIRKVTFDSTCSNTTTTTIKNIMKINISIYPNPATALINIDNIQTKTNYLILDIVGSLLQQGILQQGNNSISIQSLSPGMYMLKLIDSEGHKQITKIVKE